MTTIIKNNKIIALNLLITIHYENEKFLNIKYKVHIFP